MRTQTAAKPRELWRVFRTIPGTDEPRPMGREGRVWSERRAKQTSEAERDPPLGLARWLDRHPRRGDIS